MRQFAATHRVATTSRLLWTAAAISLALILSLRDVARIQNSL